MCHRKPLRILLLIIVLPWDWTSLVSCDDNDEPDRYFLTDMYLSLQDMNTGCENTRNILTDGELNELPAHELKATVVNRMKQVECSFVYSSLYHLKVFRNIAETHHGIGFFINKLNLKSNYSTHYFKRQFYKITNPLCFAVEAKCMLSVLYRWKYNISINAIWLSYVLYHDMARLNDMDLRTRLVNLPADLNDVQDYLEYFTNGNCSRENKYNEEYERSIYYEGFRSINDMSVIDKETLIVENQEQVKDILFFRGLDHNDLIFEFRRIFINHIVRGDDNVIRELLQRYARLDEWKTIQDKMTGDYLKCVDESTKLRHRIRAIGLFEGKFIELLEIVMLQSTWVQLTRLQNMLVSSTNPLDRFTSRMKPKSLKDFEGFAFIRKLSKHLSRFVSYIGDSSHFNGVIDMLNESISDENRKYRTDETELNDQINNVSATLNRLHSSFYDCKPMFVESENYNIKPKEFTKFLKSVLFKIDFSFIRSFIRFSREFQQWTIEKDG